MYFSVLRLFLLITFSFFSLFATAAANGNEQNTSDSAAIALSSFLYQDLTRYIPEHEIQVLSTEQQEPFLTLLKEETTGIPRGIAFILPDLNKSIYQQAVTSALYQDINNYGWTSIALTMPHIIDIKNKLDENSAEQSPENTPSRETPSDSNDSPSTSKDNPDTDNQLSNNDKNSSLAESPLDLIDEQLYAQHNDLTPLFSEQLNLEIEKSIQQRLIAAFEFASAYPGFYLTVCEGKACYYLLQLVNKGMITLPDATIMLNAHMPNMKLNRQLAVLVAQSEQPVLDLTFSSSNQWVENIRNHRRKQARKAFKTNYRQRNLSHFFDYQDQQRRIVKEIYGFTTAVGM